MRIHFQQINRVKTEDIKEFVCIKCDYVTTGKDVLRISTENRQRALCPNCDVELVGRIEDA